MQPVAKHNDPTVHPSFSILSECGVRANQRADKVQQPAMGKKLETREARHVKPLSVTCFEWG